MLDQTLTEMNYEAFQALIDNYIERVANEGDDMQASAFFELLLARAARRQRKLWKEKGGEDNQMVL